jgi:CDP-paratose 2-epimerase
MNILVTGGCGLIGSHAAIHYHDLGHHVVVMDNNERSTLLGHDVSEQRMFYNEDRLTDWGILVINEDISTDAGWSRAHNAGGPYHAIIHCAAQCGVPTSIKDPMRDFEVNALGTLKMLESARKWESKVVYASTNKVYPIHSGWVKDIGTGRWRWDDEDLHENGWPVEGMNFNYCSYGTRTPYGVSKYLGDLYCQEYAGMYGVKTGVFRMSCIYGPHQMGFEEQGWATWFAIALEEDLPLTVYGDGQQVRDMLHVDDVIKAYDAFIMGNVRHGVWNLGGGPKNTLSVNQCINVLQKNIGMSFSSVTYEDWRPSDQRIYTSDIRALKEELNWEPTIKPKEGLAGVQEWVHEVANVF